MAVVTKQVLIYIQMQYAIKSYCMSHITKIHENRAKARGYFHIFLKMFRKEFDV